MHTARLLLLFGQFHLPILDTFIYHYTSIHIHNTMHCSLYVVLMLIILWCAAPEGQGSRRQQANSPQTERQSGEIRGRA